VLSVNPFLFALILLTSSLRRLFTQGPRNNSTLQNNLANMIEPLDVFIGSPRVRRDGAHPVIHLSDNVKFQRPILLQPQALSRHIRPIT